MPSLFDAALASADAAFDATFAERVRITPMAAGVNARPAQDPDRALWEGGAILFLKAEVVRPMDYRGTGREDRMGTTAATTGRSVSIARAAIAGLAVRRGDRVTLMDQPGAPVAEIVRVERDDPTRLVLILDAGGMT